MPRRKVSYETRNEHAVLRKARLEAQLKANLRKRKAQARARADVKVADQGSGDLERKDDA